MTKFQEVAIKEVLRSALGKTANFWLYDREQRSPMNFVLDEVERQIGPRFSVYWVDGGSPEVFTLPGFSPSPVVFSTRYLSFTAFIRHLFVNDKLKDVLVEVSERATLKLMAEMALQYGDPDYAVLAFAKSVTMSRIRIAGDDDDATQVMELESESIREAYMATWFYGLVHELGHLHPNQTQDFSDDHMFSDAAILGRIVGALDMFSTSSPDFSDSFKREAVERAKQQQSNSVLGIHQIRSEGLADVFAASVLFQTTFDIMQKSNQKRFEVVQFIGEMVIFLNIIITIDRCRRVASIAFAAATAQEAALEMALHPVSVLVRQLMQREYLKFAVAGYISDTSHPTQEQFQFVEELLDEINGWYKEQIHLIDSGLLRALEFSLFPEERENDWVLLEEFRKELLATEWVGFMEAERFCKLADSLEVDGKLLKALKGIIDHPSEPVLLDPRGDLIYFVPWIEGPNGFNRPFGLDTRHGRLVFVFFEQGELYNSFFAQSVEMLKSGFTLKRADVLVPRNERLRPELEAHMPDGQSFQIIIEGTETFEQYIKEFADGTIWED